MASSVEKRRSEHIGGVCFKTPPFLPPAFLSMTPDSETTMHQGVQLGRLCAIVGNHDSNLASHGQATVSSRSKGSDARFETAHQRKVSQDQQGLDSKACSDTRDISDLDPPFEGSKSVSVRHKALNEFWDKKSADDSKCRLNDNVYNLEEMRIGLSRASCQVRQCQKSY